MGLSLLIVATICYLLSAIDLAVVQKNWPMAWTFACYMLANCGLLYAAYKPQILTLLKWIVNT